MDTAVSIAAMKSPRAIILYSRSSVSCMVKTNFFNPLFTTLDASLASRLEDALKQASGNRAGGTIRLSDNNGTSSNNGSSNFGRSPTTAVAMIILYSITGIITALFLLIIVVGAIRAHRHPERYGPRSTAGVTRQSRAKGIARAMLETLPIVKFGDNEEAKPAQPTSSTNHAHERDRDIELGTIDTGNTQSHLPEQSSQGTEQPHSTLETSNETSDTQQAEMVRTVSAPASPNNIDAATPSPEANAQNGLACSVCTDDFVKGQDIRVLPCDHKFHPECIDPWLLNVSGTCPMCRVDLRPTTSNAEDNVDSHSEEHTSGTGASQEQAQATAAAADPTSSLRVPQADATDNERRGTRQRFSAYIPHILNRHRMRDATPEERIAALRRHRNARAEQQVEPDTSEGSTRNRGSWRLSRAFGGGGTTENSRRGSYAG